MIYLKSNLAFVRLIIKYGGFIMAQKIGNERTQINFRLSDELIKQVECYSDYLGLTKSEFIRTCVINYCNQMGAYLTLAKLKDRIAEVDLNNEAGVSEIDNYLRLVGLTLGIEKE